MSDELRRQAEKLAQEMPYFVQISKDETTEDEEPVFFLTVRELPGCSAQGNTLKEAFANLAEVKVDFIESLLEDGLQLTITSSTSFEAKVYDLTPPDELVNPAHRVPVAEVSWEPEPVV